MDRAGRRIMNTGPLFTRVEIEAWLRRYVVDSPVYDTVVIRREPGDPRIVVLLTRAGSLAAAGKKPFVGDAAS